MVRRCSASLSNTAVPVMLNSTMVSGGQVVVSHWRGALPRDSHLGLPRHMAAGRPKPKQSGAIAGDLSLALTPARMWGRGYPTRRAHRKVGRQPRSCTARPCAITRTAAALAAPSDELVVCHYRATQLFLRYPVPLSRSRLSVPGRSCRPAKLSVHTTTRNCGTTLQLPTKRAMR